MIKPMLAMDAPMNKLSFPLLAQPKIDGVRGVNFDGILTGRSLKTHANRFVTEIYSHEMFRGLDGELGAGTPADGDLCRRTTSALGTIEGRPQVRWYLFDMVREDMLYMPFSERYEMLTRFYACIEPAWKDWLKLVPCTVVNSEEELAQYMQEQSYPGLDGIIVRNPDAQYKQGRSGLRDRALWRVKEFQEDEAEIVQVIEGKTNLNEAKTNPLGHTERSTMQENMVPNGMVGAIIGRDLKSGEMVKVAAGCLTHDERQHYFKHQDQFLGRIMTYKHFPKGVKDKIRMGTYQRLRLPTDVS